jgi:DNA invertase Pin-like site-specific DNA recombinase
MNVYTAIYIRVSTQDQRTDSQLGELKRYCQQRGWKKVQVFQDKISGAKSTRPELDRMVKEIRAGRVERVVAYKLDRLGRSITHLCLLTDELARLGIPLVCSSQGIDTSGSNPAGKFQLDVLKAVCEFERNLIRDRVNVGLAAAKARGIRLGRPSTLDKRAGEVIALKKRGLGVRAIARELEMPVSSVHSVIKQSDKIQSQDNSSRVARLRLRRK